MAISRRKKLCLALHSYRGASFPQRWRLTHWLCRPEAEGDPRIPSIPPQQELPEKQRRHLQSIEKDLDRLAEQTLERAREQGAWILAPEEDAYPQSLLDLQDPPPLLYGRGRLADGPGAAIVGSRQADPYGLEVSTAVARSLAGAGVSVVSGFARGIDAAAHRAALEVGVTVAVLGCGLDISYPRQHDRLRAKVIERGALVTEFPCGQRPAPWHFPVRNRIIAALSRVVVVVQAARRSGSLSTAHQALELGRDVYAVPGRIFDRRCQGANALLRDGAHVVTTPDSVLEGMQLACDLDANASSPATATVQDDLGRCLVELLESRAQHPDELATAVGARVAEILSRLSDLEIDGVVRRRDGNVFALRRT